MRRKMFSIWSVLLALVISLAILLPGCEPAEEKGTIIIKATLCGVPWEGVVNYRLTGSEGENIIYDGYGPIDVIYDGMTPGVYVSEVLDGGPPEAIFVGIGPQETQAVTSGGTVIFTLNFEKKQDASIEFITWTINGEPVAAGEDYEVFWDDIINVNYKQHVAGCEGREVTVNETSELWIHYSGMEGAGLVFGHVLNDGCAVTKEPQPEKLSQQTSVNGEPVEYCTDFPLPYCEVVTLDVETTWQLEECTNYTGTIDWLHIQECIEPPCCTLFDLEFFGDWGSVLYLELDSFATVELVNDEDVNPENNTAYSPSITIYFYLPFPP